MFSVQQKRHIANEVQRILRATNHPELPTGEIAFSLHVEGAESWSWADIRNNGAISDPRINPWNELQDPSSPEALEIYLSAYASFHEWYDNQGDLVREDSWCAWEAAYRKAWNTRPQDTEVERLRARIAELEAALAVKSTSANYWRDCYGELYRRGSEE